MIRSNSRTCGGKLIISIILPKAITSNMLPSFNSLGFHVNERLLKNGLLSLEGERLTINGTLNNRTITISGNGNLPEDECKLLADAFLLQIKSFIK